MQGGTHARLEVVAGLLLAIDRMLQQSVSEALLSQLTQILA